MGQTTPLSWGAELNVRLRQGGYTAQALQQLLGASSPDDVGLLNHAPALQRATADASISAALVRLFFLEAAEPLRSAVAAFGRRGLADLLAAGLLRQRAGRVTARLRIDVVGDQYFLADRRFRQLDRHAAHLPAGDPVYPVSSDSLLLRGVVVTKPGDAILDLCTGSGAQALQQAAPATRVIAVDINPRAAAMACLNADLNAVDHMDVRTGDLYAPVRGEQFDVILANPPFVASPHHTAASYHAGGPTGDRVLRRVIAGFAKHLHPGGRAFAVSHLAVRRGQEIGAVAQGWFANFPGRALVLVVETGTPIDLAAAQSLFALDRGLAAYAREVQRWVGYLQRHRIERVALLLIVAEQGDGRGVDVVEAQTRILPIPLTPAPAERVAQWLVGKPSQAQI